MSSTLLVRNEQSAQPIDLRHLRKMVRSFVEDDLGRDEFELAIYCVGESMMTRLNETYLQHAGSTDVITFDYGEPTLPDWLGGEIFVCVPEAKIQARRFRTTWQSELVRYIVHGVLHLCGYDDRNVPARQKMKRVENRMVRKLALRFNFTRLGGHRHGAGN